MLSALAIAVGGCGVSRPAADPDTAELAELSAQAFITPDFGAIDDYPDDAITPVVLPRRVIVSRLGGDLTVFVDKDPANGCRLQLVDAEIRTRVELPASATFWDPCHGSAYGDDGRPVAGRHDRPMNELDVEVRDGRIRLAHSPAG